MADRCDYYFRQKVTESELDLGFTLLENADRNLASDIGIFGIISGAAPSSHAPVADLTIDLTAAATAYDHLGERIYFGTGQRVDCSVDLSGVPTDVKNQGNERSLGVFLRFTRQLSDARTDGNSQQVYFRRDESFQLVVRQGVEAAAGATVPVPLQDAELLVCDVRRAYGRTQILAGDIDTSRRQAFVFARASAVQVDPSAWKTLVPAASHTQAALDATDGVFTDHLTGAARRHPAEAIDFTPHGFLASKTVGAAIGELVDDLLAMTGTPGSARIGADGLPGAPAAIGPGSVRSQLVALLAALNAHLGAVVGAHAASAIAAAPFGVVTATSVQAQLQQVLTLLAAASGATLIGGDVVAGKPYALAAGTLTAQITAVLGQLNQLVSDLAALTAGLGAAKIGNVALSGSPKTHPAAVLAAQLQGLCDDLNTHIPSGDHDARYPRLTYSNMQLYNAGQSIPHGNIGGWPAIVTSYYDAGNVGGQPTGAFTTSGSLSAQIVTSVTKNVNNSGYNLSVQNATSASIWILVNVYRVGT
ncbi:MAG: hypothetical protein ACLQBL_34180 [Polyangiaceae bacterium]